jgi:hypothetical protein
MNVPAILAEVRDLAGPENLQNASHGSLLPCLARDG